MKALILTAGCSRRLRPLTDYTPKCLLPVGAVPLLRRSIENLRGHGFDQFVVVTGFLAHKVRNALATWFPDLEVSYINNPDYATTNNAYSLLLARPELDGSEFFLLDGDIVYDAEVIGRLLARGSDCLALRTRGDIGMEEVKVAIHGEQEIRQIGKEVPVPEAVGESVGIEYFSAATATALFAALDRRVIGQGLINEYYEAAFQEMLDLGVALSAVDIGHLFAAEIDTREDLAAANQVLLSRKSLTAAAAG